VRAKRPNLVFLMETKMLQKWAATVRIKLGFGHCFVVDCHGKGGGLMMLWKDDILVEIQNYSRCHINAVVRCKIDAPPWKLTDENAKCHIFLP
jgi:hypothetical protein